MAHLFQASPLCLESSKYKEEDTLTRVSLRLQYVEHVAVASVVLFSFSQLSCICIRLESVFVLVSRQAWTNATKPGSRRACHQLRQSKVGEVGGGLPYRWCHLRFQVHRVFDFVD